MSTFSKRKETFRTSIFLSVVNSLLNNTQCHLVYLLVHIREILKQRLCLKLESLMHSFFQSDGKSTTLPELNSFRDKLRSILHKPPNKL